MRDGMNREIDYVRLSVTDRCDFRCTYCMPLDIQFLPEELVLSKEEILFLMNQLAQDGIKKVKITGGEPLVRRDIIEIIREIKQIPGIENVTITTNGMLLEKYAEELKEAGLDGLNLSLDTLDPVEFHQITRVGKLEQVWAGLEKALAIGLPNIKLNTVARKAESAENLVKVAALAKKYPVHVRFIEMMPIGLGEESQGRSQEEVQKLLTDAFGPLKPFDERLGNGPAVYYALAGFKGKIGFISAVGHCFCETCNRIRITAGGNLKTCLHMDAGTNLRPALLAEDSDALQAQLRTALLHKPEKHHFADANAHGDTRFMSQIGG